MIIRRKDRARNGMAPLASIRDADARNAVMRLSENEKVLAERVAALEAAAINLKTRVSALEAATTTDNEEE